MPLPTCRGKTIRMARKGVRCELVGIPPNQPKLPVHQVKAQRTQVKAQRTLAFAPAAEFCHTSQNRASSSRL